MGAFRGNSVDVERVTFEPVVQIVFGQSASFGPIVRDWSAWCKFNIRGPSAINRSFSMGVGPRSVGRTPDVV